MTARIGTTGAAREKSPLAATAAAPPASPASWVWTGMPAPAVLAATPDLALGAVFLTTWIAPWAFSPDIANYLLLAMILEFIIIHSSAIMGSVMVGPGPRDRRVRSLLGLGAFYTLFVGGFSLAFHTIWPLLSFWVLTGNRLLSVFLGQAPSGEEKAFLQRGWAATAMCYLGFTFLTILAPVPRLGITPEVVSGFHLTGSGLWVDQPWRVLALGFLYFTAVGLSELHGHRWLRTLPQRST